MDLAHFDIAHYTGHKALDELAKAYRIYSIPIARALAENCVQVTSMDFKEDHDIELLAERTTVQQLELDQVDPINAFHWGGYLTALRKKEAECCINTAIFFQSMMESTINDAIGKSKKNFHDKWEGFLSQHEATVQEKGFFETYLKLYRKVRKPSVHPKTRIGIVNIEEHRFPFVHDCLMNGWFCFVFLLNKTKQYDLDYAENWKEMSEDIHRIPSVIHEPDFVDMSILSGELYKKHLDHFNK